MNIGIIGFQGDVAEHADLVRKAARGMGIQVAIVDVRKKEHLRDLNGLIIPGGESTTIYKLLKMYGLYEEIKKMSQDGFPVMGTCAGLILISSKTNDERVEGMGLVDVEIERNAYGRQINSFMDDIEIKGIGKYRAVFIRAPVISDPGNCEVLAYHDKSPVMIRNGNIVGLTFHPELTPDARVHELFMKIVEGEGYISTGRIKE